MNESVITLKRKSPFINLSYKHTCCLILFSLSFFPLLLFFLFFFFRSIKLEDVASYDSRLQLTSRNEPIRSIIFVDPLSREDIKRMIRQVYVKGEKKITTASKVNVRKDTYISRNVVYTCQGQLIFQTSVLFYVSRSTVRKTAGRGWFRPTQSQSYVSRKTFHGMHGSVRPLFYSLGYVDVVQQHRQHANLQPRWFCSLLKVFAQKLEVVA